MRWSILNRLFTDIHDRMSKKDLGRIFVPKFDKKFNILKTWARQETILKQISK
jgi:hypothetical protein